MKKTTRILAAVMALGIGLSGCGTKGGDPGAGSANPNEPGDELSVSIGPDPETIDPALNSASDGGSYILHAFEGLLRHTADGIKNGQAESYEKSEDGLTWTFHLREGLKWSNGQPLTAHDFEYGWKRAVAVETAAPYAEMFDVLEGYADAQGNPDADGNATTDPDPDKLGVTALDDRTLEVRLAAPCAYFEQLAAFQTYMPVQRETIEKNGDAWATHADTYIGNGPYKIVEWVPGEFIRFQKNENYWDYENLGTEYIKFLLMEDDNATLNAFQNKTLQFAKNIASQEIPNLRDTPEFHLDDMMGTYYLNLNIQKDLFADPRVRKALSLAIDRKYIADTVMQGTYAPAGNMIGPGVLDADGKTQFYENSEKFIDTETYEENLEEAKKLLAEAGYPGGEGFPSFEYYTNDQGYHKPVAEALQQMWGELGLKMNIQVAEWKTVTTSRRSGDFEAARNGWVFDYNDPATMLNVFVSTNGNNDGKFSSPEFDAKMEIARTSGDQEVRFEAMHEAERILMEEAGAIPIAFYREYYLMDTRMEGFWHSPLGYFMFAYATIKA